MQIWPVPSRRAGPRFAIRHHHLEGRCRRLIHGQLYAGQSPQEHEDGENCEGQPSLGGLAGRVVLGHFVAFHLCRIFDALVFKSPDSLRLPHAEENHRGYQGNDAGGDVHKVAVHVIRPEPLRGGEGASYHENGRKDFERFRPADHCTN